MASSALLFSILAAVLCNGAVGKTSIDEHGHKQKMHKKGHNNDDVTLAVDPRGHFSTVPEDEKEARFEAWDSDKDGAVSLAEFKAGYQQDDLAKIASDFLLLKKKREECKTKSLTDCKGNCRAFKQKCLTNEDWTCEFQMFQNGCEKLPTCEFNKDSEPKCKVKQKSEPSKQETRAEDDPATIASDFLLKKKREDCEGYSRTECNNGCKLYMGMRCMTVKDADCAVHMLDKDQCLNAGCDYNAAESPRCYSQEEAEEETTNHKDAPKPVETLSKDCGSFDSPQVCPREDDGCGWNPKEKKCVSNKECGTVDHHVDKNLCKRTSGCDHHWDEGCVTKQETKNIVSDVKETKNIVSDVKEISGASWTECREKQKNTESQVLLLAKTDCVQDPGGQKVWRVEDITITCGVPCTTELKFIGRPKSVKKSDLNGDFCVCEEVKCSAKEDRCRDYRTNCDEAAEKCMGEQCKTPKECGSGTQICDENHHCQDISGDTEKSKTRKIYVPYLDDKIKKERDYFRGNSGTICLFFDGPGHETGDPTMPDLVCGLANSPHEDCQDHGNERVVRCTKAYNGGYCYTYQQEWAGILDNITACKRMLAWEPTLCLADPKNVQAETLGPRKVMDTYFRVKTGTCPRQPTPPRKSSFS